MSIQEHNYINLIGRNLYVNTLGLARYLHSGAEHYLRLSSSFSAEDKLPDYKKYIKAQLKSMLGDTAVSFTNDYKTEEANSIASYYIEGAIFSSSTWWGFSTEDFIRDMKAADANPNINGHFIIISSPGGDTYSLDTAFDVIRHLEKPSLVLTKEMCCSAAYYLASAAQKILSVNRFDTIGSIGTMCIITDLRKMLETWGIKEIEIYATESTEKNKYYRDALDGKTDDFIKECIDPLQDEFAANVKAARPLTLSHKDAGIYNGKTYFSSEALSLGLIDGVASMEEAMSEITSMSADYAEQKKLQATILNNY